MKHLLNSTIAIFLAAGLIVFVFNICSFTVSYAEDTNIDWIEVQGGKFTMGSGNSASEITLTDAGTRLLLDKVRFY
jgi:hypothetical protein